MVGLADLKRHTDRLKTIRMTVNNKYCYFQISGLGTFEFLDILNYKSWVYKTYQKNVTVRYVNLIKNLEKGNAIVRTSIGFGPLLLRYLRIKGYQINDQDIEAFRSRLVVFPDLKLRLYDFQERMVNDWINVGSVGVIKSPTGSGKCARYDTLILTNKGLIKIEDIVKRISDSGNNDKDVNQSNLYDSFGDESVDDENIKGVNSVISISSDLNYDIFSISSRYDMGINETIELTMDTGYRIAATPEHKIIIINKDGNLEFKKLEDITVDDYVAITYNTNIFNDKLKLNYWFRPSKYDSNARFMKNIEYMNEDIARLLGYIISEGTDFGDRDGNITNYDKEILDDIIKICEKIGLNPKYVYREGKNQGNPVGMDIYSKYLLEFLHYLGYRHGSKNKEIPWSILQADKKSQIMFIRSLFDGDGTVYHKDVEERKDGQKYAEYVSYASSSRELCQQLQMMLLNMGIISSLETKKGVVLEYRGEFRQYDESYLLYITGGDLLKFAEIISFGLTRKKDILDKCVETLNNRERWTDIIYPNIDKKLNILYERLKILGQKEGIIKTWEEDFDFDDKIIRLTRKRKMSHFQYLEDCKFRREMSAYVNGKVCPSKLTLDKILKILNPNNYIEKSSKSKENQIYRYLLQLSNRFIFDKVESIKKGKDRIYDMTIEGVHSYIGNGVINHNTVVGCAAIKKIGRKALILVHTSDLLINVWNDSLIKTFGHGIMSQVGIIGGGLTEGDRMAMKIGVRTGDFEENIKKDIVIATFQSLNNKLGTLSQYKFGLMIVDEAHHVPAAMFRKVNAAIRAPYKMGLSATTKRLDGLEKDVFSSLGDIQTSVSIRELINKGILAEPRFQSPVIVDHEAIDAIESCGHAGLIFSRFVKKTSASSTKKKDYIINICKNVAARDRKFLLFTDYVHAEDVYVRDMYAESLLKEGIRVSIIDQGMSTEERSAVFGFLETGEISGIVFGKLGSEGVNIPSVDVVIMANAIKCVSGDILIPTDRGIIRAEDLGNIKPNIVSTMDLEDRSIIRANINKLYNFDEEDTIRIMTSNGYEIEGSLSHMIIIKDKKDNLSYKSLCDICIDDEVIICGSNIYGKDLDLNYVPDIVYPLDKYVFSVIDRINNSDLTYKIGGFKYKYVKVYYEELKKIFSPDKMISPQSLQERVRYRFGKRGVSVSRPRYDEINDKWFYTFDNSYQGAYMIHEELRKDVVVPKYITKDLAELLGYIVSEGYIDSCYNTVEIVNLNDYMVERLIYLFKSLFDYDAIHSILEDRNNIRRVRCHSKTILEFLNYLNVEHRSGNKVVPWCILRSGKDIQLTFLRALFVGDGGTTNRNNIVYGSTSKRLCDEIHMMLLNMGIISKKHHNGTSWNVLISSTEADKFMKDIGFSDNREFEYDIDRHNNKRLSILHYKDGNVVFFDNVLSKVKCKNKLYDMNIDKYHSFIGGGFMNHNSPITFTQRVGRVMRKVPGKDFCDVYEILLDVPTEYRWSDFNFAEYKMEGFQKLVYKIE